MYSLCLPNVNGSGLAAQMRHTEAHRPGPETHKEGFPIRPLLPHSPSKGLVDRLSDRPAVWMGSVSLLHEIKLKPRSGGSGPESGPPTSHPGALRVTFVDPEAGCEGSKEDVERPSPRRPHLVQEREAPGLWCHLHPPRVFSEAETHHLGPWPSPPAPELPDPPAPLLASPALASHSWKRRWLGRRVLDPALFPVAGWPQVRELPPLCPSFPLGRKRGWIRWLLGSQGVTSALCPWPLG